MILQRTLKPAQQLVPPLGGSIGVRIWPSRTRPPYTWSPETQVQAGESTPIVLLVEDDRDGRRMYADWLTQAGFRVEQAHNGLQALERALDARPHVVVTDLNIPGIDGFELTRRLRQDSRTRDVPVIAVTGPCTGLCTPYSSPIWSGSRIDSSRSRRRPWRSRS